MKLASRVAVAALAVVLVIPTAAGAKSSGASVKSHVTKAHHAIENVMRLTVAHKSKSAKRALKVARHESAAASRAARRTKGSAAVRANAYAQVAAQYNEDLSAFTGLLGHSGGGLQSLLGQALQPAMAGRQQALSSLQGLLGSLPTSMLPDFTQLITGIIGATAGQASSLAGLLGGGLPGGVGQLVEQALATATGIATAGIAQVEQLLSILPADQQAAIKAALDQIVQDLAHLSDVIGGILGTPGTPTTPTPPTCPTTPTTPTGSTGGLLGGLLGAPMAILAQTQQFLQQILGIVLGGGSTPAGPADCPTTTPTAGGFLPFPGLLQGLLGGLGLGGLGGIGLGGLF